MRRPDNADWPPPSETAQQNRVGLDFVTILIVAEFRDFKFDLDIGLQTWIFDSDFGVGL